MRNQTVVDGHKYCHNLGDFVCRKNLKGMRQIMFSHAANKVSWVHHQKSFPDPYF